MTNGEDTFYGLFYTSTRINDFFTFTNSCPRARKSLVLDSQLTLDSTTYYFAYVSRGVWD